MSRIAEHWRQHRCRLHDLAAAVEWSGVVRIWRRVAVALPGPLRLLVVAVVVVARKPWSEHGSGTGAFDISRF